MRNLRYIAALFLLSLALGATAAPREIEPRDPSLIQKLIRTIKHIVHPLGDGIVEPHP